MNDGESITIPLDRATIAFMIGASMNRKMADMEEVFHKAKAGKYETDRAFVEEVKPLAQSLVNLIGRFEQLLDERDAEGENRD